MKPIDFPERTVIYAKDQPPFLPLPAYRDHEQVISRWQLTWRERFGILWTGRLWCRQITYGGPPYGQSLQVETPFVG